MKISVIRYELNPRRELNARVAQVQRTGALLKFEFAEGIGYADCHPLTEFGDAALDAQLEALRADQLTPLLQRSLFFAQADAKARAAGVNLFAGAVVPVSHANLAAIEVSKAMLSTLTEQGFKTIKLKFGLLYMNSWSTIEYLMRTHTQFQWRLDFNASFNAKMAQAFLMSVQPDALEKIEFIEDPSPFNASEWVKMQTRVGRPLAADFESDGLADGAAYKVRIIKPAVQDPAKLLAESAALEGVVLTSYMDHPLGQAAAAWSASQLQSEKIRTGGFQSHTVYEKTAFSELLGWDTPFWRAPEGTGFGFDQLLAGLEWKTL